MFITHTKYWCRRLCYLTLLVHVVTVSSLDVVVLFTHCMFLFAVTAATGAGKKQGIKRQATYMKVLVQVFTGHTDNGLVTTWTSEGASLELLRMLHEDNDILPAVLTELQGDADMQAVDSACAASNSEHKAIKECSTMAEYMAGVGLRHVAL
jgi:hypothetical protein